MRHLTSEQKLIIAAVLISLGMLFLTQVALLTNPVPVSEKELASLILALVFLTAGIAQVVKAVRSI